MHFLASVACLAMSNLSHIGEEAITVKKHHAEGALPIIEYLLRSTVAMFNLVGADQESTEEQLVLASIQEADGIDLDELTAACGLSRRRVQRIILTYMDEGVVYQQDMPRTGRRGRPKKLYYLH